MKKKCRSSRARKLEVAAERFYRFKRREEFLLRKIDQRKTTIADYTIDESGCRVWSF